MMKTLLATVIFLLVSIFSSATEFTAKQKNGFWHTASVWTAKPGTGLDLDNIPDGDDIVIILGSVIQINDTRTCQTLIINNDTVMASPGPPAQAAGSKNSALTIASTGSLSVAGDCTLKALYTVGTINLNIIGSFIVGGTTLITGDVNKGAITVNIGNNTIPAYTTINRLDFVRNGTGNINTINFYYGTFEILGDISASGTNASRNVINIQDDGIYSGLSKDLLWGGTAVVQSTTRMRINLLDIANDANYLFTYNGFKDQMFLHNGTNFVYRNIEIANQNFLTYLSSALNTPQVIMGRMEVNDGCTFSDSTRAITEKVNAIKINAGGTYRRMNSSNYNMNTLDLSDAASIFEFYVSTGTSDILTVDGNYGIVKLSGPGVKRLLGPFDSNARQVGSITVTAGTFQYGNTSAASFPNLVLSNAPGQTHTIKVQSGATLLIPGNLTSLPDAYFDLDVNSTVHYSLNGTQKIWELPNSSNGQMSYGNLKMSTTGNTKKVINSFDTIEVRNTVSIGGLTSTNPIQKDQTDLEISANSCLSLLSTEDYTGSIDSLSTRNVITYLGSGASKGTIIVRRYISLPDTGFRDYCSPVKDADLYSLQNCGLYMTGLPGSLYGPPMYNYTYVNAFYYDETQPGNLHKGWTAATAMTQKLALRTTNDTITRSAFRVFGGGYDQSVLTLMDKGTINTGDQVHKLSFNTFPGIGPNSSKRLDDDGFHLIGNPYARPLDWDKVFADPANKFFVNGLGSNGKGILPTIYIYRPNDLVYDVDQTKNYGEYNAQTGVSVDLPNDGIISSFQGFFVKVYDANQNPVYFNLTIKEKHKADSGNSTFYKSEKPKPELVTIRVNSENFKDKIIFHEFPQASYGLDLNYDILRFHGQIVDEYYGPAEVKLGINFMEGDSTLDLIANAIPATNQSFSLPLHLIDMEAGEHTLTVENLQPFLDKFPCVSLYDNVEDRWYDLKSVNTIQYQNPGNFNGKRFTIHFQSNTEVTASDATCADSENGLMRVNFDNLSSRDFDLLKNNQSIARFTGAYNKIKKSLTPGDYVLIDKNGNQECSVSKTPFVIGSAPEIKFDVVPDQSTIKVGVPVVFTNNTSGGESFSWTFYENNSYSNEVNPTFVFQSAGTKLVKLDVHSINEECSKSKVYEFQAMDASGLSADKTSEGEFLLYLNNDILVITPANQNSYDYYIRSVDGKLIAQQTGLSGTVSIPTATIKGPVVISVNSEGNWYTKKLFN